MENDVEHIIEIDDFTEIRLKIPKTLTAIELKALMNKANKLFNIAEVPLEKTTRITATPSEDAKLFKMVKGHVSTANIAKKLGKKRAQIQGRITYLRNTNKWNDKLLEAEE